MSKRNGMYGLRLNAPYNIAYSTGLQAGKDHPEWTEAECNKAAALTAYSMVFESRMNAATRRYYRELAHAYLVGVIEGQTGKVTTEDEWVEQFEHPREVYQKMKGQCWPSSK